MTPKAQTTIYPVEGRYVVGVPAVETTADAETAAALVETGAFTTDKSGEPVAPVPEE